MCRARWTPIERRVLDGDRHRNRTFICLGWVGEAECSVASIRFGVVASHFFGYMDCRLSIGRHISPDLLGIYRIGSCRFGRRSQQRKI